MNFALVGIGKWGKAYIKAFNKIDTSCLVATCSRSQNSYDNLPHELRVAPHYDSFSAMVASHSVDTVVIATHPDEHYNIALQALQLGKNVICEKPCMFTYAEFNSIEKHLASNVFFTDYTNLYHKIIDEIKLAISKSQTKPTLKLTNIGNGPFRDNYSDIWDYGSHAASVVYHLFPNTIFSIDRYTNNDNHEVFLNSEEVSVELTFGNMGAERQHVFELLGSDGPVYWKNDRSENPLKLMLEKFVKGEVKSNIYLSRRIFSLLSEIETKSDEYLSKKIASLLLEFGELRA